MTSEQQSYVRMYRGVAPSSRAAGASIGGSEHSPDLLLILYCIAVLQIEEDTSYR